MRRRIAAFALGAVTGFALWSLAPVALGRPAWDGGVAYLATLVVAGALVGWVDRASVFPGPLGLYLGQLAAIGLGLLRAGEVTAGPHPALYPLFLAPVTLCALAGAAAVAALPEWLAFESRAWSRRDADRR